MNDTNALSSNDNPQTAAGETGVQVLLNLENLVKTHITRVDTLKVDLKKHKEMLDDIFSNDETYKLNSEKAKEAAKVKAATKAEILKRTDVGQVSEKVKAFKAEIKELEAALSDYLREYQRLSGSNEIEGNDGEVREIVYVAKLVKKTPKFKK